MSARMLALGCPRWPIVAADLDPDAPAAVFHANRVVSSSLAALADGVRRGMRRREAQARCPGLEVLPNDRSAQARAFEVVVQTVETFSPKVEVVRPGLCVLPVKGPARYFGGEHELRRAMSEAVDEAIAAHRTHELHVDDRSRTGIADGPFAATMAAVRGTVVDRGTSRAFLAPFSVDTLDLGELGDLLHRLGIHTLGELAALPLQKVVARFGADGAIAHRLARGDDERLLELRDVPPDLTVERELDPPAEGVDVAMFAAKSAADELAEQLTERGLACAKLAIHVETEHGEHLERTWRYSSAFTSGAIAERVRWQLEGWLAPGGVGGVAHRRPTTPGAEADQPPPRYDNTPTAGISLLRLRPEDVGPATGTHVGLWSKRGEVSDLVRRSIARVQGLLGPQGARSVAVQGGRHPSEQSASVPWGDPVEVQRPGLPGIQQAEGPVTVELPVWPGRLPTPSPVIVASRRADVVSADGTPVDVSDRYAVTASPARVRIKGTGWRDVVGWAGPWPVDEHWWDEVHHHRGARFQVALSDGTAHLLTVRSGAWSVDATYD